MKQTILFSFLFFWAFSQAGCIDAIDDLKVICDEDEDCGSGELCMNVSDGVHLCTREDWCGVYENCQGGLICDIDSNTCIERQPCPDYTGTSGCCDVTDWCELSGDGVCHCQDTCSWDTADCQ